MTTLREAALRVLAEHDAGFHGLPLTEALEALRAALAQQAEPVEKARAWYTVDEINDKFAPPQQAEQAEPVEPVAWMYPDDYAGILKHQSRAEVFQPLTEEQIKACEQQAMVDGALPHEQRLLFARAIERAHGII